MLKPSTKQAQAHLGRLEAHLELLGTSQEGDNNIVQSIIGAGCISNALKIHKGISKRPNPAEQQDHASDCVPPLSSVLRHYEAKCKRQHCAGSCLLMVRVGAIIGGTCQVPCSCL